MPCARVGPRKWPASLRGNGPAPTWKHGSTWKSLSWQTQPRGLPRHLAAFSSQAGSGLPELARPLSAPAPITEMWALDSADLKPLISPGLPSKASRRPVAGALSLSRHLKTRATRGWKRGATQATSCLAAVCVQSCQYCGTKERSARASGRGATAGKEPHRALARGTTAHTHASSAHTQPSADSRSVPGGPASAHPLPPLPQAVQCW